MGQEMVYQLILKVQVSSIHQFIKLHQLKKRKIIEDGFCALQIQWDIENTARNNQYTEITCNCTACFKSTVNVCFIYNVCIKTHSSAVVS